MKAAVLVEPRNIQIRDVQKPEPAPGEVLIRVSMAGICGSDNSLYQGKWDVTLPMIPGHEAIGRVAKLGEGVTGPAVGQRVTIQPNFSCGECKVCQSGHANICPEKIRLGVDIDGVFAEYVKVPARYTWAIPEALEDEVAVLTEPLAVAVHALNLVAPRQGEQVLIFGAGLIGLLTLQLAILAGAEVTACDLSETRLKLAKNLGAAHIIDSKEQLEAMQNTFDVIYETSGAPTALATSVQLAARAGKIVILGFPSQDHPLHIPAIVRKELQIRGSMIYTDEFPQAIELFQRRAIQTAQLLSGKLSLGQLNEGLKDFNSPNRVKMLVEI
jgi:2-desacetyl-2-hydroxyethyl bacteriochlorophyllide A dehydrogenase